MTHLFVDVSSHGFGHLAQAAPVLNEFIRIRPDTRLTIRCGLPLERLRARIDAPFDHIHGQSDFGFVMIDAVSIDLAATAEKYRLFHADWNARVETEAAFLGELCPDLVLTDVAYLPLAGAALAGIPSLSMCSLNWADLFWHFFGREAWAESIHRQILSAYQSARFFLRLTPSMPMPGLGNARTLSPVALLGNDRGKELRSRIGADDDVRLVLIAFGGFDKDINAAAWPPIPGVRWLVPEGWAIVRDDMTAFEPLKLSFSDLIRSVDAVLTKPGYGTFAEAACNGTSVLYVRRDDWPEQEWLIEWLDANARCQEVAPEALLRGDLADSLARLRDRPAPAMPRPDGAGEAARLIASLLP